MQNKYVGDAGDFGKLGLLRFLSGHTDSSPEPHLRLGLIWYLYPDEIHGADKSKTNNDGGQVGYLYPSENNIRKYGDCDRELWDRLAHLVGYGARCVHCLAVAGVLPADTDYYDAPLSYVPRLRRGLKMATREHWLRYALLAVQDSDLVFVDPDNGISVPDSMYQKTGPKFTYISDLEALWERNKSLVVYQHVGRDRNAINMARAKAAMLAERFGVEPMILHLRRGRGGCVHFVVPQPDEKGAAIEDRAERFLDSLWNQHFDRIVPAQP